MCRWCRLSIHKHGKKATGYDMLPSKLLKTGSEFLSRFICRLVNMSFKLSSFPNYLNCAEVSPIHKKDSDLDVSNYRPVIILSSMSYSSYFMST